MKILIVEDDRGLSSGISFALAQEGYEIVAAGSQQEGLVLLQKETPDGVILDLNLPDGDGIWLCSQIRKKSQIPVLILTARDMEVDEIRGLESGADDYITKPFSVAVLKIRLEKALKKYESNMAENRKETELVSGSLKLNTGSMRVYREECELELSRTEFRLLQYFLENKNQILLKEQILQYVWDDEGNFVEENTLQVNISRLRKKTGTDAIRTVQGMGYLWEEKG